MGVFKKRKPQAEAEVHEKEVYEDKLHKAEVHKAHTGKNKGRGGYFQVA